MANIKGASFIQQENSMHHLLKAFGVSRHFNRDDRLTHSEELAKKRRMYIKDFIENATDQKLSGKLNTHMGDYKVVKDFLLKRITHMCKKTSGDYVSGISSMFTGLVLKNISISDDGFQAIEDVRALVKEMPEEEFRTGRFIINTKQVLNRLFDKNFESGVLGQIQKETGFRISEAYKFVENPEKYLVGNTIVGLIGKSRHMYGEKKISNDLIQKLSGVEKLPTQHTYSRHLKFATLDDEAIPHDWRVTYAKAEFDKRIAKGMSRNQALREVSIQINHFRIEMTEYYLLRA